MTYPAHPSAEELLKALKNPAETLDATLGEMEATSYATAIIVAHVNLAMGSIQGSELEAFIQECIRTYTERACKLLRPASEDAASRNRIAHLVDLYTTTALASIRMISHVQAALKNGMEWEEVARMVPGGSELPDDVMDDEIEIAAAPAESNGPNRSQAELAASRQRVVMPILKRKRWSRGKLVTESGVGKNSVYEYLDGKRNPGYDNRKAMADALGLTEDELPQ